MSIALSVFQPEEDRLKAELQREPTVEAILGYCAAKKNAKRTAAEYETTARRWASWLKLRRSVTPTQFRDLTAADFRDFLIWAQAESAEAGDTNPGRTANKRLEHLKATWKWLARQGKIDTQPIWPDKVEQRSVAGHYFLTDAELESIYWATYRLPRPRGWAHELTIGHYWRAAIVFLRNYGVDTQVLFPNDCRAANPLRWRHITRERLPPGRVANVESEHGWVRIRRQKTDKLLFFPLEPVILAHLEAIRPREPDPDGVVFAQVGGCRPAARLRELIALAGIAAKLDVEADREVPWVLKDLRKTCATAHNANRPGSAQYVLGHSTGVITDKHYASQIPLVLEAVRTLSQPAAFRSILDETIARPPGLLFAK